MTDDSSCSAHILVIDDEESIRQMLSFALSKENYDVWSASSGAEALESLRTRPCDLVILDLNMPEENGLCGRAADRGG